MLQNKDTQDVRYRVVCAVRPLHCFCHFLWLLDLCGLKLRTVLNIRLDS